MEDLFKKFVNAGVGYIAQGNKKVQSTIDKLVKDSKISEQEGKKIVDEFLKSSETKRAELEKQFQGLTDRLKGTVGLGGKTAKKAPAKSTSKSASSASKSSATAKAAGATKKAADKVSSAAGTAQKSAAAKAGATKKPAAKKPAASSASAGTESNG